MHSVFNPNEVVILCLDYSDHSLTIQIVQIFSVKFAIEEKLTVVSAIINVFSFKAKVSNMFFSLLCSPALTAVN